MNDVYVRISSVSKVHAYFMVIRGRWHVSHGGATNGLTVSGQALKSDVQAPVESGSRILFGPDALATFYLAEDLHAYLTTDG